MPTDIPPGSTIDPADLLAVWATCLPDQPEQGRQLIARYAEPHRRYHDGAHLAYVLDQIDRLATRQDLFVVRLAAWFHDAVYAIPPGELTNEEASVRLARRALGRAGFEQEDLNEITRLIRLTATHRPGARDPEGELLCDADLAILGSEPEDYARYVAAVRAEYAKVPDEEFAAGRLAVLVDLGGGELFRTTKGRQWYSERARANVDAEIKNLADQLGVDVPDSRA